MASISLCISNPHPLPLLVTELVNKVTGKEWLCFYRFGIKISYGEVRKTHFFPVLCLNLSMALDSL